MPTPIKEFYIALDEKEEKFRSIIKSDNLGMLIRSAITELDWYYYNFSRCTDKTYDQVEQSYILHMGTLQLVKLALETKTSFDAAAFMYVRDSETATSSLEITAALGMIQHGRRVAQTAATGFCTIKMLKKNDFIITLPRTLPDPEHYERELSEHYSTQYSSAIQKSLKANKIESVEQEIEKTLTELVFPFAGHWIGYGGDPLVDEYFFGLAYAEIMNSDGIDTFNYATLFGGIPFQHYVIALTFIISLHKKHERFAEALVNKDKQIKLENILTITAENSKLIKNIEIAVNHFGSIYEDFPLLESANAKAIFDVLSIGRNSPEELWRPGASTPLIIQTSDDACIRCLAGAADKPVQFMLNSLRLHYPKDYDTHQRKREKSMCNAVKKALSQIFTNLEFRENIKVKLQGKILTDIDLVIIDRLKNTILLCQLKHQELYGSDLHAKLTRSSRLKQQASQWLESVNSWIAEMGDDGIRSSLQMKKNKSSLSLYKVFITRHYAHPINEIILDNDTVFGNFLQFQNAIVLLKQKNYPNTSLSDLVTLLKTSQSPWGQKNHIHEPDTVWTIDDLKFLITSD